MADRLTPSGYMHRVADREVESALHASPAVVPGRNLSRPHHRPGTVIGGRSRPVDPRIRVRLGDGPLVQVVCQGGAQRRAARVPALLDEDDGHARRPCG